MQEIKKLTMRKSVASLLILIMTISFFSFSVKKTKAETNVWENVGAEFSSNGVAYTDIAFNSSTNEAYVVFQDAGSTPSYRATVKKFDGTNWVLIGARGFTSDRANYNAISFNPITHEPYVAFQDEANSSKLSVMKFNGTSWDLVGPAGISDSIISAKKRHVVFDSAGNPFVIYSDSSNSYKSTVKKFNGSSWVTLGSAGLLGGRCSDGNIAISHVDDSPYVVCADSDNSSKLTVVKFDGSNWIVIGNAGFSTSTTAENNIGFGPVSNSIYVAFEDDSQSYKSTVMVLNGSTWNNLGAAGFSSGTSTNIEIDFIPDTVGNIYIGFDGSVMTYNGGWSIVGASTVQYDGGIAFDPSNAVPYVVYLKNIRRFNSGTTTVPTASPAGATYTSAQSVTLSTATSGASIYYTIDGSVPTTSSTLYSGAISVGASETIKAIAIKSGMINSDVVSESYVINIPGVVSAPVASPDGGTYTSDQTVSLSTTTSEATIYYTNDGSTPTNSSTQYISPISITSSVVLKAFAVKSDMTDSSVMTSSFTINKSSGSSSHHHKKKKKKKSSSKYIVSFVSSVPFGGVLVQSGKKFTKNGNVAIYFSRFGGGYYPPKIVKTSATGSFSLSARIYKPKGSYSWYAINLATGKKSKTKSYSVR